MTNITYKTNFQQSLKNRRLSKKEKLESGRTKEYLKESVINKNRNERLRLKEKRKLNKILQNKKV